MIECYPDPIQTSIWTLIDTQEFMMSHDNKNHFAIYISGLRNPYPTRNPNHFDHNNKLMSKIDACEKKKNYEVLVRNLHESD